MNSRFCRGLAALALYTGLVSTSSVLAAPPTGKPAPLFMAKASNGASFRLQDLRGKVVLLDFWMPGCPPCRISMPALQRLQDKYAARGLRVIGVAENAPSLAAAKQFTNGLNVRYPFVMDSTGKIFEKYGLSAHPSTVIIDARGIVRYVYEGYVKGDDREIEAALQPLLKSAPHPIALGGRK